MHSARLHVCLRHFKEEDKKDKWLTVVQRATDPSVTLERNGEGPAPVHSPLSLSATIVSPSKSVSYTLSGSGTQRKAYVHVPQTSGYKTGPATGATVRFGVEGNMVELKEGDGLYVHAPTGAELILENPGTGEAEVVLFNLDDD